MNFRMLPILQAKPLAMTIVAMHVVPLILLLGTERLWITLLPSLFVLLMPLFFILYKKNPLSEGQKPLAHISCISGSLKIMVMALLSFLLLFLISYFSLKYQPLIPENTSGALWVALPGNENIAYVLRLFLQMWLFALVCVMAGRWLTRAPHFSGFLLRFYAKKDILPWLLDFVAIGGVFALVGVVLTLACQQLFYLMGKFIGLETVFTFPQMGIFIFLLAIYILHKSSSFTQRLVYFAGKSYGSLTYVYLAFIGFLIAAWGLTQVAIAGLPDGMAVELAQAIDIRIASLDSFSRYWPIVIIGCSLFMVAPLSVLLSRVLQASSASLLWVAIGAPIILAACFLIVFPSVNEVFWAWVPSLNFATVSVTDALVSPPFNGFSILLMLVVISLLCMVGAKSVWIASMVEMSPDTFGRRERRFRENAARFFKWVCFVYAVFGVLGVYGLAFNIGIYVPSMITLCAVLVGLALQRRFTKSSPVKTCMEVNG